jgi:hypothetical protein
MAGDEHTLLLSDNSKKILEQLYLGKLRYYKNDFSLENYKYSGYDEHYKLEKRISNGKESYTVLNLSVINEMKKQLLETTLTEEEKEAYEEMEVALKWMETVLKKYKDEYEYSTVLKDKSIHFVFYTEHDF